MARSIREIKDRIKRGEARVLTAQELCDMVEEEERSPALKDVDVVTTATRAIMSGTYAVLSFPVKGPSFKRAEEVWLNGVPAHVGPCPNESLGVLDLMVFGTAHSREDSRYGGGHLFRDLAAGKTIDVEVKARDREFSSEVDLAGMPHARLFGTRHSFKNYSAFVNPGIEEVSTIFHARQFEPRLEGCTFSGCGQLSPLKGDPGLETLGVGTRILMNGRDGFVLGTGTRSTPERPNLAGYADIHGMDPEYMGGFVTSAGPECVCSWAVPVPVTGQGVLDALVKLDKDIPLPVMDVVGRREVGRADYGQVWKGSDLAVRFRPEKCRGCEECEAERLCPTRAISLGDGRPSLDRKACFNCGLCSKVCDKGVFSADLGSIRLEERTVPVVLRQSDRLRALRLAGELKRRILDGSFQITERVERI